MKKLFTERARLVIYLEQSDVIRMTSKAKEAGEPLVEWARNVLRNELTQGVNPVDSGTESRRGVHEGRASRRLARQVSTGEASKDTPRKPPKERDMAAHAEAESPSINTAAGPYDAKGRLGQGSIPNFRHTAESNWRTCLCGTCVKKRKDYGL